MLRSGSKEDEELEHAPAGAIILNFFHYSEWDSEWKF